MRGLEKFLAVARGVWIETQDAFDEGVHVGRESVRRADLRDEADLLRVLRSDGLAEEYERKREARQGVLAEVGHDRGRRKAELHLGKSQGRARGDKHEVAHDRQAKTEAERVALDLRDADQWRNSQGALEFDEAGGFVMNRRGVPARALPSCTKDLAACPQAQDTRAGMRCFETKFCEHGIEHCASYFVVVFGIVQSEI